MSTANESRRAVPEAEESSGERHGLKIRFEKRWGDCRRKSPGAGVRFLGRMREGKEAVTTDR